MEIIANQVYVISGEALIELGNIIAEKVKCSIPASPDPKPNLVRGIKNLAAALNVSVDTIVRHKREGVFTEGSSYFQRGRTLVWNVDRAREEFFKRRRKGR